MSDQTERSKLMRKCQHCGEESAERFCPDCTDGLVRIHDAAMTEEPSADLSSWMATPHRLAVDAKGYVWRAYTEEPYWSMAPVNPDNSLVPGPITFYVPESSVTSAADAVAEDDSCS